MSNISVFTSLTKSICVKKDAKHNKIELLNYFPDFLWLLRDVMLDMADEAGNEMSPTDFIIKRVLKSTGSRTDAIGEAILSFFPKVTCFVLPPPSLDKKIMKNIAEHEDKLNFEFNEGIEELIDILKNDIRPKQQFATGGFLQGNALAHLVQQYIEQINSPSAIPVMEDAWECTVKVLNEETQTRLLNEYTKMMAKKIEDISKMGHPLEEGGLTDDETSNQHTILGIHHGIKKDLTNVLLEEVGHYCTAETGALSQISIVKEFVFKLEQLESKPYEGPDIPASNIVKMDIVGGALLRFVKENHDRSRDYCEKLFNNLYEPIASKLPTGKYLFKEYMEDILYLRDQYNSRAIGPAKWEILESKNKFLEQEEVKLKQLEGYKAEIIQAEKKHAEEQARNNKEMELLRMQQQQVQQSSQALNESLAKMHKLHTQALVNIQNESSRRETAQMKMFENLILAGREREAEQQKSCAAADSRLMEEMMRKNNENIVKRMEENSRAKETEMEHFKCE